MDEFELTLLRTSDFNEGSVLIPYGLKAIMTDLACLTHKYYQHELNGMILDNDKYSCNYWLENFAFSVHGNVNFVDIITHDGIKSTNAVSRENNIRPVLRSEKLFNMLRPMGKKISASVLEVEFGEYPQSYAPNQDELYNMLFVDEVAFQTGRFYTIKDTVCFEYEFPNGKKYIYLNKYPEYIDIFTGANKWCIKLNGKPIPRDSKDYYFVEVAPVKWLIDQENKILICKDSLISGIKFDDNQDYEGDFNKTLIKRYLDQMSKEMFQQELIKRETDSKEETVSKVSVQYIYNDNPFNVNLENIDEKATIKTLLESNIPVFLHGKSSDGKSARVKQLDPDCVILYLRNATPDSLNGKSVYNQATGEMIDIKPTWLVKLEERCQAEPDKIHILFLDELTNALPSIQGMVFNIVLDREVNGIWKLPSNARIVAAGNELSDSLAANELAEPLFNRFAHVYIETDLNNWLKWAIENNIHPAIYAYIAYKGKDVLRTKYDGVKPNADPRKWEMASKVLYTKGKPELLRPLIGEELTNEFVAFCKQKVITLEDVLNDNYSKKTLESLNLDERYATAACLSMVDEENFEKVRNFVTKLGGEIRATFDSLWAKDDEKRLSQLAEIKLKESAEQEKSAISDSQLKDGVPVVYSLGSRLPDDWMYKKVKDFRKEFKL